MILYYRNQFGHKKFIFVGEAPEAGSETGDKKPASTPPEQDRYKILKGMTDKKVDFIALKDALGADTSETLDSAREQVSMVLKALDDTLKNPESLNVQLEADVASQVRGYLGTGLAGINLNTKAGDKSAQDALGSLNSSLEADFELKDGKVSITAAKGKKSEPYARPKTTGPDVAPTPPLIPVSGRAKPDRYSPKHVGKGKVGPISVRGEIENDGTINRGSAAVGVGPLQFGVNAEKPDDPEGTVQFTVKVPGAHNLFMIVDPEKKGQTIVNMGIPLPHGQYINPHIMVKPGDKTVTGMMTYGIVGSHAGVPFDLGVRGEADGIPVAAQGGVPELKIQGVLRFPPT